MKFGNATLPMALWPQTSPRAFRSNEEAVMWISLFTIVLAIAIALAWGALALENYGEEVPRTRKAGRGLRPMHNV